MCNSEHFGSNRSGYRISRLLALHILIFTSRVSFGHPTQQAVEDESVTTLETVQIEGRATDLLGIASSASQGVVGQPEFKYRPLSRVGELVEVIPGAIATQHSGTGKANQFFLRGFNLDHGTDFSVAVDGVPMNMSTHAHGQGYLDLNSVIPELVDQVEYGKGPYFTEIGDFSSAGYALMHTIHRLPKSFLKFTGGEFDYYRGVGAHSIKLGDGDLLTGAEVNFYDGPWDKSEQLGKYNGLLKYTLDRDDWGMSLVGKAYRANWDATNQIAKRAEDQDLIGHFGTLNPTDGGKTDRYSVSGNVWSRGDNYRNEANLYAVYYDVSLWSDFTYFLDYPERGGDQIKQHERRVQIGGSTEQTWYNELFGLHMDNTLGLQLRHDEIMGLSLNRTVRRDPFQGVRTDDVSQTSVGLYAKNQTQWLDKFRTVAGLRGDFFVFDVDSRTLSANSGHRSGNLVSPKLSLIFGPWYDTELFINMGYGYHSNDARGTTVKFDPNSPGDALSAINPLARSRGAEVGARTQYIQGLTSTLAFWWLEMDSELVFVGDAGTTEASGGSERYGVEWTNYYKPVEWLTLDADFAFTSAWYSDAPDNANDIPNSVGRVISAGATVDLPYGLFASLRLRHFGHVPLIEDGSAQAGNTNLVNLGAGYQNEDLKLEVDVFNLFGSTDRDIAYYYESRLRNETVGVADIHYHPVEPRMVRVSATVRF